MQTFLANQIQVPVLAGGFSNLALRAKASALWDLATKVASSWNAGELSPKAGHFYLPFYTRCIGSRCGVDPVIRTRHAGRRGLDQPFYRERHACAPVGGCSR